MLIVGYHHVVPDFEQTSRRVIPALVTSTRTFERQLATLATSHRFADLGEALGVLNGSVSADRDLCVVTFDDGYRSFAEHAMPVLARMGIPAVVYVPSAFVGGTVPYLHDRLYLLLRLVRASPRPVSRFEVSGPAEGALRHALAVDALPAVDQLLERWGRTVCLEVAEAIEGALGVDPAAALEDSHPLSWDELRAVRAAGFEVGSHTVDHACLHRESRTELAHQLRNSKSAIERELGAPVVDFSYPNGWYTPSAIQEVQAAGYRSAVTTESRLNPLGQCPFVLKRKVVWEYTTRGVRGFSPAVASCNFDDVFAAFGVAADVRGRKPDPVTTIS